MKRLRPLLLVVAAALAIWIAQQARARWGIGLDVDSARDWVAAFGWKAPAVYVGVLTFRPFLLLPSMIVLPVGGAVFGTIPGTALGAAGMTLAALLQFGLAHGIGREGVERRLGASLARLQPRIQAAGPFAVGLITAHPTGPMTALHWGAALTSIPLLPFVAAVFAGAIVRAFLYSFFGASLGDDAPAQLWLAAGLLIAFFLLPLAHPQVRRQLTGRD